MKMKCLFTVALLMLPAAPLLAESRPDHFSGLPAETLPQAVANLSEYNIALEQLLAQGELGPEQLGEVHELTYTLENALERISAELEELAVVLEEVHVASETNDAETVRRQGQVYLETARQLVP